MKESPESLPEKVAIPPIEAKTPPIKPGEVFDPELELARLKVFREDPKRSRDEREAARRIYRDKLEYQKEGRVLMQEHLIQEVRKNPDISAEQLRELAEDYRGKFGFSTSARFFTSDIIEDYVQKHRNVRNFRSQYLDSAMLYAALFGKQPKDAVDVIEGPMTLYLRCIDPEDYAWAYRYKFLEIKQGQPLPQLTEQDLAEADKSGAASLSASLIPGLEGVVNIENTARNIRGLDLTSANPAEQAKYDAYSQSAQTHEEEHAFRRLFKSHELRENKFEKLEMELRAADKSGDDDKKYAAIREYLIFERDGEEHRFRDELLAYLKEHAAAPTPANANMILDILTKPKSQGGLYDYFGSEQWKDFFAVLNSTISFNKNDLDKILEQVFVTEHREILKNAIDAFIALRLYGYTPEATVAHLISEPIIRWPQVARRAVKHKMGEAK